MIAAVIEPEIEAVLRETQGNRLAYAFARAGDQSQRVVHNQTRHMSPLCLQAGDIYQRLFVLAFSSAYPR